MKYKISNERLKQLIFKLLNKELEERGRFHSWVDSYGYTDLRVDDEYGGLMVLVDEEEIKVYPALYRMVMDALGMDVYQLDDFLTYWATTELPKKMPLGKKYFLSNKYVDILS